jgi:hypothetical protein
MFLACSKGEDFMVRLYIMPGTHREGKPDLSKSTDLMRVKSVMCVPLISKSKIRGVIYVDTVIKPNGFRRLGIIYQVKVGAE